MYILPPEQDIIMYLNSPGGSVTAGKIIILFSLLCLLFVLWLVLVWFVCHVTIPNRYGHFWYNQAHTTGCFHCMCWTGSQVVENSHNIYGFLSFLDHLQNQGLQAKFASKFFIPIVWSIVCNAHAHTATMAFWCSLLKQILKIFRIKFTCIEYC